MDDLRAAAALLSKASRGLEICISVIEVEQGGLREGLATVNQVITEISSEPIPGPEDLEVWRRWVAGIQANNLGIELALSMVAEKARAILAALDAVSNQLTAADPGGQIARLDTAHRLLGEAVILAASIQEISRALPIEADSLAWKLKKAKVEIDGVIGMLGFGGD